MSDAVPILSTLDLRKTFVGRRPLPWIPAPTQEAVKGVTLDIARGAALGVVGESGCGKSTLARMMVGLLPPTSGEVLVEDQPVWINGRANPVTRGRVQMVFQDPMSSLNPRKTVADLIAAPMIGLKAMSPTDRRARIAELMDMVGLRPEFARRHPHEFSGGQRQRIGIARALAAAPEVLILDEPVSALDVSIQAQVLDLLGDLRQRLGLTYVFISHDLAVVSHLCERVAVMYFGEVVEHGETAQVLGAPEHDYTRLLISSVPGRGHAAA